MGLEWGTSASNLDAGLSSKEVNRHISRAQIKDLFDPRLPKAFQDWIDFRTTHYHQVAALASLEPADLLQLTDELSHLIGRAVGVDTASQVSVQKVFQLTDAVSGDGNRIVFMRHGEQSPPEWIYSIPDRGLRKIRMMQDPFNRADLLTNQGVTDVFATALSLLYVTQVTGKRLHVLSSENFRAKEVGEIIARVVPASPFSTQEGLNCITYKDEADQPPVTVEELLADLPMGVMPWNPVLIDKWCKRPKSGIRQSEAIIQTIRDLIYRGTRQEGDDLFLVLTHSQQLTEVLQLRGKFDDFLIRFPELTMIALTEGNLQILPRGVLKEESDTVEERSVA